MQLGLYKQPSPIDKQADRELKLGHLPDYSYAQSLSDCVLTTDEFLAAADSQPIAFSRGDDGKLYAAAVLGWPGQGNSFVGADGHWRANSYIPAFIRRYPFVGFLAEGNPALAIDRDCPATGAADGEPLFGADGEPAPRLVAALNFEAELTAAIKKTELFLQHLDQLGLLEPFNAVLDKDGERQSLSRVFRVAETKLDELPDDKLLPLVRSGGYKLILAHLLSLRRFASLSPD